jgi:hypothetical protein
VVLQEFARIPSPIFVGSPIGDRMGDAEDGGGAEDTDGGADLCDHCRWRAGRVLSVKLC